MKCTYCHLDLTPKYSFSLPFPGITQIHKCNRWWCNYLEKIKSLTNTKKATNMNPNNPYYLEKIRSLANTKKATNMNPIILIIVEGGVVQNVISDSDVDVIIKDLDNISEGDPSPTLDNVFRAERVSDEQFSNLLQEVKA